MTNIMEFQKFCEWCHQPFASQKMTTRYCSHACNSKAYKANKREEAKKQYNNVARITATRDFAELVEKEILKYSAQRGAGSFYILTK